MRLSTQSVLASSRRYLDLIGGKPMSESEMHAFIGETVDSYEKHVNRGFISYRKSVTEAGQFAALEWAGRQRAPAPLVATVAADTPFFPDDLVAKLASAVRRDDAELASQRARAQIPQIVPVDQHLQYPHSPFDYTASYLASYCAKYSANYSATAFLLWRYAPFSDLVDT
jgi:hypothetical protein